MTNELRIGNLYIDLCGKIGVWNENSFSHYKNAKVSLAKLKPIPLTKDWFKKLGFKNKPDVDRYVIGRLTKENHYQYECIIYVNDGKFYTTKNIEIKYVHLLQNYYYFNLLTEKELTIKE